MPNYHNRPVMDGEQFDRSLPDRTDQLTKPSLWDWTLNSSSPHMAGFGRTVFVTTVHNCSRLANEQFNGGGSCRAPKRVPGLFDSLEARR